MRSGIPATGNLYVTPRGRTVEILAVKSVEYTDTVNTHAPVGAVFVIAFRFAGATVVHLTTVEDAGEWVKVQEAY